MSLYHWHWLGLGAGWTLVVGRDDATLVEVPVGTDLVGAFRKNRRRDIPAAVAADVAGRAPTTREVAAVARLCRGWQISAAEVAAVVDTSQPAML